MGCDEGATLGQLPTKQFQSQRGCGASSAHHGHIDLNAVGVVFVFNRLPKLGAGAPTLGFGAQSRWDYFADTSFQV